MTDLTGVVTPTRKIQHKGEIKVVAEDNAMVLMDHGNGLISHVQSGFNYFNPHGHDGSGEQRHTVSIVGTKGYMGLVGYDWDPRGVDLATEKEPTIKRHAAEKGDFVWQIGALSRRKLESAKRWLQDLSARTHDLDIDPMLFGAFVRIK